MKEFLCTKFPNSLGHGLTLIAAWINICFGNNVWDEITVEVWEWLSNFIPHFVTDVKSLTTHECDQLSYLFGMMGILCVCEYNNVLVISHRTMWRNGEKCVCYRYYSWLERVNTRMDVSLRAMKTFKLVTVKQLLACISASCHIKNQSDIKVWFCLRARLALK